MDRLAGGAYGARRSPSLLPRRPAVILLVVLAAWAAIVLLVLALCLVAAQGDALGASAPS